MPPDYGSVHERQRVEAALGSIHDLLTGILDGASDLVAALDSNYAYLTFNRAYQAELKRLFDANIYVGARLPEALAHRPVERNCLMDLWGRALRGEEFTSTHEFIDPEHGCRVYEMRFNPIRGQDGGLMGAAHIVRDISRRKQIEDALRKANAELERSNAELERFASIVSHDLRSPMLSISGYIYLLEFEPAAQSSEEIVEAVSSIRTAVDQMNRLLTGLLDYARVGRGGLRLTENSLETTLNSALTNLRAEAQGAQARIAHDPLPVVRADHTLLMQLLQNLIENAIKYRGEAPSRVHVSAWQTDRKWIISVSDNGIGIAPEYHDRIFGMFQRLHADESRYTGMGVGLALCKKIVERHGGQIWVKSQPGAGSTFYFSLPANP